MVLLNYPLNLNDSDWLILWPHGHYLGLFKPIKFSGPCNEYQETKKMYQQPQQQFPMSFQQPGPAPEYAQQPQQPQMVYPPPQQFYNMPRDPMNFGSSEPVEEVQVSGIVVTSALSIQYGMILYAALKPLFNFDRYEDYCFDSFKLDALMLFICLPSFLLFGYFTTILFNRSYFSAGKSAGYNIWPVLAAMFLQLVSGMGASSLQSLGIIVLTVAFVYLCYGANDESTSPFAQCFRPYATPVKPKSTSD